MREENLVEAAKPKAAAHDLPLGSFSAIDQETPLAVPPVFLFKSAVEFVTLVNSLLVR